MCKQVPSDLNQNHSVKMHKEYEGWRMIAEKETDLKGKRLFRP
jgi:hypothetical protein